VLLHKYKLDELDRKLLDVENAKLACVRSRNAAGAKEAVQEKHKLLKKRNKVKEVYDFCLTLLDQISEAASVKETINTLAEAQSTFGNLNAPMLYKKMDRISSNYDEFRDALAETNTMLAGNMSSAAAGAEATDAELLEELEQLNVVMSAGSDVQGLPNAPTSTPAHTGTSVFDMYRQAGLA
jgi:regulator of sigma D